MLVWMLERCLHRRNSTNDGARAALYAMRVNLLHEAIAGLQCSDDMQRIRVEFMLLQMTMTDISSDEHFPNYHRQLFPKIRLDMHR